MTVMAEPMYPSSTPLSKWLPGWLKLEVAHLLNKPEYLVMYDDEKRLRGYPVSEDEMRQFIYSQRHHVKW
jgi:hypothetical protein